jgi:hypothetical protein
MGLSPEAKAYLISGTGIVAALLPFLGVSLIPIPFPIVHALMYVGTSVWTYCLELVAGLPQHPRPLADCLIMALNLVIFTMNSVFLMYYLGARDDVRESPAGVKNFVMFFIIFETSIYCVHRYLLHAPRSSVFAPLARYHKMHHARTCDGISGCDLFYMHPVDLLFQFLATSDLGYIGSGCNVETFQFTALLTMWMYVIAHSRVINYTMEEWTHLEHHRDGDYYHGTGVFMDLLMDPKYRAKTDLMTHYVPLWTAVPILYVVMHYVGTAIILSIFLLPVMGDVTYKVIKVHGATHFGGKGFVNCPHCDCVSSTDCSESEHGSPCKDSAAPCAESKTLCAESKKAA